MRKLTIPLILQSLVFLIPLNYYAMGSGAGNGVQWALFRYQQDIFGNYLSSVLYRSLDVIARDFPGQNASAAIMWDVGASLLVACFVLQILSILKDKPGYAKFVAIITILSGLLFLLSDIFQYGLWLNGPNGLCIPFGIPVIIVMGVIAYRCGDPDEVSKPELPRSNRSGLLNELVLIIFISVFVKIIVFSISMFATIVSVNQDITLYYNYMNLAISGNIPYIDYMIEYPQFFLIPVFIAAIPSLILHSPLVYLSSFMILMLLIDTATLIGVYFIALRLFGQQKAFLCSVLYATAFSSAFLVATIYDSFPVFFLVVSVLLFLYGKEVPAYISATVGTMAKWFPVFCFPYYILFTIKNKRATGSLKKGILLSCCIVFLTVVPFIVLNYQAFLKTYLFHVGREAYFRSWIYYMDLISKYYFDSEPFVHLSLVFLVVVECALLYWYYRYLDGKQSTLCYLILLSIFCFILLNKVFAPYYILWVTPFLALFLINSVRQVFLFYLLQVLIYIEHPILLQQGVREYSFTGTSLLTHPTVFDPFVFYSVKFMIFFVILYVIIRDVRRTQSVNYREKSEEQSTVGQT